MQLINGPYNNRAIEDSGAVMFRMAIYESGRPVQGEMLGSAYYEPSENRDCAFWSHNTWDGILEEEIRLDM